MQLAPSLHFFIFLLTLKICSSFNFDLNFVEIISVGSEDQHFGYSVLLQKGVISSVIVGAPNASSSYQSHESIKLPGAVYKCDIGVSTSCQQYVIEDKGNTVNENVDDNYSYKDQKDGGLLGASIDGGEYVGDRFFVCSPRWKNDIMENFVEYYLPNGICYEMNSSMEINTSGKRLMPMSSKDRRVYTVDEQLKHYYGMAELGLSMHYLKDKNTLLLGAPGVLGWRGTIVELTFDYAKSVRSPYTNTPNPYYVSSLEYDNYYFGYTISSGRFQETNDVWYVSGAPRAEDLFGMVLIFKFGESYNSDLNILQKFIGEQFGSYFGESVAAVTTGKGVADLLVGAPTHSFNSWDEGCVYFYKNNQQGKFGNPKKIVGSKRTGARFGTAISAIGDINQDTYLDIAISAPYEEGSGVVYIYLGGLNGLNTEYSQRIAARSIKPSLKGFGFSLSKGVDIDDNLYNDFAVGAYKSGEVAVMKSRPVIKYVVVFTSNVPVLFPNSSTITVNYCLNYTSGSKHVQEVQTRIAIIKDIRALDDNETSGLITVKANEDFCDILNITMKEGNLDYIMPFKVELLYELVNTIQKDFCSNCPVTDPNDKSSAVTYIPYVNGCGPDNVCRPNLKVSVIAENTSSLIIGQLTTLRLGIKIENNGDPAYGCRVSVQLPVDVDVLKISNKCKIDEFRRYQCAFGDILERNISKEIIFDFDIRMVNPEDRKLNFNFIVSSQGDEFNEEDNKITIAIPLQSKSLLDISGTSYPHSVMLINESTLTVYETVEFSHEYVVKNLGPSPLHGIVGNFYLPVEINDGALSNNIAFHIQEPKGVIHNQTIQCTTNYYLENNPNEIAEDETTQTKMDLNDIKQKHQLKRSANYKSTNFTEFGIENQFDLPANRTILINCNNTNIKCMKIVCSSAEVLHKNEIMMVTFLVRARVDVLRHIIGEKDIILLRSTAETITDSKITLYHVPTLLMDLLIKPKISYWIYVGSAFAAIVILCIIVFILYKLNFFRRPLWEQLQNINSQAEGDHGDLRIENVDEPETSNL